MLEIAEHVLPDQLRVAAVAIISRRGEFFVKQFGQLQQRRGGELAVGVRIILGGGDERRQQVVFAEPKHASTTVGAKLRVGGEHGVAQGACQSAMLFVDDRFPTLVDLMQPANDFPAAGVAVPIQKCPQRSFLNIDARGIERGNKDADGRLILGLREKSQRGFEALAHGSCSRLSDGLLSLRILQRAGPPARVGPVLHLPD